MRDTRERILGTALRLFNARGLSRVTLRTIAKELKMSQGNLNYHFKKREDIIIELYNRLVYDIDQIMIGQESGEVSVKSLFDISDVVMQNFYSYRFILLHFKQVMQDHPSIKKHFQDMAKLREQQMVSMLNTFVENGLMKKEEYPNQFLNLCKRYQILGDFWMSSAGVLSNNGVTKKSIKEYGGLLLEAIHPYLTKKGKVEFNLLFDHYKGT